MKLETGAGTNPQRSKPPETGLGAAIGDQSVQGFSKLTFIFSFFEKKISGRQRLAKPCPFLYTTTAAGIKQQTLEIHD
ncbi:MAG: hypothetical protein IT260_19230 [Saprospiraceae bacterium]|nr:hypothetical protein [Saprospiraceae bacterium]